MSPPSSPVQALSEAALCNWVLFGVALGLDNIAHVLTGKVCVCLLLQSWLYKLRGDGTRHLAHVGSAWHKKYFVLIRDCNKPCLLYFTKKPKSSNDLPRGGNFGTVIY